MRLCRPTRYLRVDKLFKLEATTPKRQLKRLRLWKNTAIAAGKTYGRSIVYPSDEWYLTAGRPIPPADFYDEFAQLEDGVGMWRRYHDTFLEELARPRRLVIPRKLDVVTGTLAAPLIAQMAQAVGRRYPGVRVFVHPSKTAFLAAMSAWQAWLPPRILLTNARASA